MSENVKRKPGRPPVKVVKTAEGDELKMLDVEKAPPTSRRKAGYQVWRSPANLEVNVFYDRDGKAVVGMDAMALLLLNAGYEHLRTVEDE